jgi:hypothetical protein
MQRPFLVRQMSLARTHRFDAGSRMSRPLLALGFWTLFIWVNRLRNVVVDDDLSGWSWVWRFGVAVMFIVGGGVLVGGVLLRQNWAAGAGGSLALIGGAWWFVRGIGTLFADFSVGFKVVHTVLALVTVCLGFLVVRELGWLRSLAGRRGDRYHPPRYG